MLASERTACIARSSAADSQIKNVQVYTLCANGDDTVPRCIFIASTAGFARENEIGIDARSWD